MREMRSLQSHFRCQQLFAAARSEAARKSGHATPYLAIPGQLRAFHQQQICANLPVYGIRSRLGPCRPARSSAKMTHHFTHRGVPSDLLKGVRSAPITSKASVHKEPTIHNIFEPVTGTWQYVVADPATLEAVIIDPVLDYDPESQSVTTKAADLLLALIKKKGYHIGHILETHAHADHLTAASYLQSRLAQQQDRKPLIGIGKRIVGVQALFGKRYAVPAEECAEVFEKFFEDDEAFAIGDLTGRVIHLPGHTPDHVGYTIGDNVFCGDSIFHADIGTARCDFPGGNASQLYHSAHKLLDMPGHVKIWTGHDYPPENGRDAVACLTVDEHRQQNKHLSGGISEESYVALRKARDEQMAAPRLLHQSLQINIRGGHLPEPTLPGIRLLHLPLKLNSAEW